MKDSEGISQRTYVHGPYIQTTVWGWPEGRWMEVGKGGGEVGTIIIVSVKIKEKYSNQK